MISFATWLILPLGLFPFFDRNKGTLTDNSHNNSTLAHSQFIYSVTIISYDIYRVSRGNVPDFGRMFLTIKHTDITQNTYIRS